MASILGHSTRSLWREVSKICIVTGKFYSVLQDVTFANSRVFSDSALAQRVHLQRTDEVAQ